MLYSWYSIIGKKHSQPLETCAFVPNKVNSYYNFTIGEERTMDLKEKNCRCIEGFILK